MSRSEEERIKDASKAGINSNAKRTDEEKREIGRRLLNAYMTNYTPEERREIAKRTGVGKATSEQLSNWGKLGIKAGIQSASSEQRSEWSQKGAITSGSFTNATKEQQAERGRKGAASLTSEKRSQININRCKNPTPEQRLEHSRKVSEGILRKNAKQKLNDSIEDQ